MTILQNNIMRAFLEIGEKNAYKRVPNVKGILSTTFTHAVFAMPHIKQQLSIHGLNTAFRPTDNDEGTHLVSFNQYYLCTNIPIKNQISYVEQVIKEVIKKTFPLHLHIEDIELKEGSYEWHADSTKYRGGGAEINIVALKIAGKWIKLGKLELAQINDYDTSGGIKGNRCHLIVFGIERLINLYSLAKKIIEHDENQIPEMTLQELYNFDDETSLQHKRLIDAFFLINKNDQAILTKIDDELLSIKKDFAKKVFSIDVFEQLSYVCSLAECAYAANIITRDFRKYLIRQQSELYKQFADDILRHPDSHLQYIYDAIEASTTQNNLPENQIYPLHFFRKFFPTEHINSNQILHKKLITEELQKMFLIESGDQKIEYSPLFLLKQTMFIRAVGRDLSQNIEDLAKPVEHVHTLTGTIKERLYRINMLLDFLKNELKKPINAIDIDKLQQETRFLALDWRYYSIKIYPALEGLLGNIALRQQGYSKSLANRVLAFHTADKPNAQQINDASTFVLILVGMLDEAAVLYSRYVKQGKGISSNDPYGIRQKIGVAIDAAINLGFTTDDLYELLKKIVSLTPSTNITNMDQFTNYLIRRMSN